MRISLAFSIIGFAGSYLLANWGVMFGSGVGFACGLVWFGMWLMDF